MATKYYVDLTMSGINITYYMLNEQDPDVTTYKKTSIIPVDGTEYSIDVSGNSGDSVYVGGWITPVDATPSVLPAGIIVMTMKAKRVSGNLRIYGYFELYERKSDGSEVLIGTSAESGRIRAVDMYAATLPLFDNYYLDSGSRIVIKAYVRFAGSGGTTTVRVFFEGNTASRLTLPTSREILDTMYAAKLHAYTHALGGEDELSLDASQIASGVLDILRIPDLPRSKITDFFSSPFWDNIPDKPSTFPPDPHNHDGRYYTKTQLQTSGQAQVHWDNITNKPTITTKSLIAIDESEKSTNSTVATILKQFNLVKLSAAGNSWNTLTIIAEARVDTTGQTAYLIIYIDGAIEAIIECTETSYTIKYAQINISNYSDGKHLVELGMRVSSSSATGYLRHVEAWVEL